MKRSPLPYNRIVFVCTNQRAPGERVCCADGGGKCLRDTLKQMVKDKGLRGRIRVSASGCMDRCEDGPNIMIFPDNIWYSGVQEADLPALLDSLIDSLEAENALPRGFRDKEGCADKNQES